MKILRAIMAAFALAVAARPTEAQSAKKVIAQKHHDDVANNHGEHQQAGTPSPPLKGDQPDAGPHGGTLQQVGELQVEALVQPGGLRLFAYNHRGQPIELSQVRGLATLQIEGNAKRYRYDLFPEVDQQKRANSLAVAVDLSQIAGKKIDVAFQLVGLQANQRGPLQFTTSTAVPMTAAQKVAAAIARQKVCPVSGQSLGAMGKPIPVTVGDKTVYVCCAACIDAVKENPAKYLSQQPLKLTVAKTTAADADAIARQKVCPVMGEPLGGMRTPLKVTGLGRDVYLCCRGCVKILEKDPQKYLAMLPPLPEAAKPEVHKATVADAQFVAAQKLCPVMDEPLNAMGGPYRTVVQGKVVYLCCPGCAKKLHADPTVYFRKLAERGVTPPRVK